jgi:hypothetical protein
MSYIIPDYIGNGVECFVADNDFTVPLVDLANTVAGTKRVEGDHLAPNPARPVVYLTGRPRVIRATMAAGIHYRRYENSFEHILVQRPIGACTPKQVREFVLAIQADFSIAPLVIVDCIDDWFSNVYAPDDFLAALQGGPVWLIIPPTRADDGWTRDLPTHHVEKNNRWFYMCGPRGVMEFQTETHGHAGAEVELVTYAGGRI